MPGPAQQLQLLDANESGTQDKPVTAARLPCAWLLKRVFRVDLTLCPRCHSSLKLTELVTKRDEILKRLAQQALGPMPPSASLPKVPGQLALRFDSKQRHPFTSSTQSPAERHWCLLDITKTQKHPLDESDYG